MISCDITFCLFHFHSRTSCPPPQKKNLIFLNDILVDILICDYAPLNGAAIFNTD